MSDFITVAELRIEAERLCDENERLEAENAKLREQVERLRTQLADMTESVGRVEERCAKTFEVGKRWMAKAARFEAENTKLRELVRDMLHDAMENICSKAYWCGEKNWQTCNDDECGNRLYVEMASELGVDE